MGAKDLTTPGGLVELGLDGSVIGEYAAASAGGPVRYMPSVNGVTDTGLLAHPHGIDDPAGPGSGRHVATTPIRSASRPRHRSTPDRGPGHDGTVLEAVGSEAGPTSIAQLPVGNGREKLFQNNAPEGSCRWH